MKNSFDQFNISDEIKRSIKELGYTEPTVIQEKVIPEILFNKDLMVQSQTGSGKTAAFLIPLCEKIKWEENDPQVLILAPTRELAIQIKEDSKNIGRFKRIKGVALYGKAPFKEQVQELKGKTHIISGTPGRVLDHIDRGTLVVGNIKYLVIDEGDEMLNMGFVKQIEGIFRRLPKKRITMLFSATMPEEIKLLCEKYLNKPVNIHVKGKSVIGENIQSVCYKVNVEEKLKYLRNLLLVEEGDSSVIFCRTKENVDIAFNYLDSLGYSVGKIHGGMLQKERLEGMNSFKSGAYKILVATDIASRGIDVEGVSHVINFDIPLEKEAYVHRIGRTARAGKSGKSITFVTSYEDKFLKDIEEYIGGKINEANIEDLILQENFIKDKEHVLKIKGKSKAKKERNINEGISKLYFNGGKKKKIRAVDFVGTLTNIDNVNAEDIGIIEIQENGSYVEILNGKGNKVLNAMKEKTIKGKKLKVEKAKK